MQRSCNEVFPTSSHCDLDTNNVIKVQFVKKIYYFFVNIVMFFIPILLMTICYSMIVAKLYCSSSPGERIGGVTPQVFENTIPTYFIFCTWLKDIKMSPSNTFIQFLFYEILL